MRWRFLIIPENYDLPLGLTGWNADGVIALCNTSADQQVLQELECPVINISGALRQSPFPRVRNDFRKLARIGASFLRSRGIRLFRFYGVEGIWYSDEIIGSIASGWLIPRDDFQGGSCRYRLPSRDPHRLVGR